MVRVGAYTGSSLSLPMGLAFCSMLTTSGADTKVALELKPSCFPWLCLTEVELLLLRISSLLGAGSSLSSGVASLKRSWCEGMNKNVEGDWICFISEEIAL